MVKEQFFIRQDGTRKILIGGVRTLGEFTHEAVSISCLGGAVRVLGQKLKIARFDENEIEISGKIESLETRSLGK